MKPKIQKSGIRWGWMIFCMGIVLLLALLTKPTEREGAKRENWLNDLVKNHQVAMGMTKAEVIRSWGKREGLLMEMDGKEIWIYFKENSLRGDLSRWALLFDRDGVLEKVSVDDGWKR